MTPSTHFDPRPLTAADSAGAVPPAKPHSFSLGALRGSFLGVAAAAATAAAAFAA
eukprot:CAMPEP_0194769004 /NCGR_PEP_ID=MMETSP0323_2-20130528/41516_1 /TAXON_ID=2866 ORGANISM="Crypthecodinium cohnii, Strain Seligo" /NCGR_SAMPLE_ID=MMETSP0323_2 /ASSEMBLY_ACC=CAM_ASM_000346 /LENGTH=54 /DNA_ID=CAMNT_0039701721 /DNA_START=192 /DNA_END=353 /DNA_ORIENTATION=+